MMSTVVKAEIKNSVKSDHSVVLIDLKINEIIRGPGVFNLNNSLLLDGAYKEKIKKAIRDIKELKSEANPAVLWSLIKGVIRNETISYSSKKHKTEEENLRKLEHEIDSLEERLIQVNNNSNSNNNNNNNNNNVRLQTLENNINNELRNKKEQLEEVYRIKAAGILTRLKMTHLQGSEKNLKYLKSLETHKAESKIINQLCINGKTVNEQNEILDAQMQYYKKLYEKRNSCEPTYNFFQNHDLPTLNEQEKQKCEGLLTDKECESAIKDMKNGKSPGSDGLTVEFYKIFWQDLKDTMLNSFNHSFQVNSMSDIQKQGLITLLPKSNKNLTNLSNWRPISLLNVDYKIMSKAIANRIKKVLKILIDSSQTGFIKGRYIGENIRLLFDIIEYTEEHDLPGILLFTDFEKAFDSINHEYIEQILDVFNFGPDIKSWVKLFYNNATSCVLYNGYLTSFFPIQRGVRQGCPLSPYIFILGIEILSVAIRQNKDIRGITIYGKTVKTTLFADDCTVILDGSEQSYNATIHLFEEFGKLSGLNLNFNKCVPLKIGSLRNVHDIVYSKKKEIIWNKDTAKALGIHFHSRTEQIMELNFKPRIEQFRRDITSWKKHKLTTTGNITVFKTFILSKLTYLFSVLPSPSSEIIKSLKQQSFEFIWNNKRDKIKRDTLIKPYEEGGLRMVDLNCYVNSLKIHGLNALLMNKIREHGKYVTKTN